MAENENLNKNEAIESTENIQTELDQPEEDTVSLDDVLTSNENANLHPDQQDGEMPDGKNEENAAPQSGSEEKERVFTQKDIDRIFGERANGLRKQFRREHAEDIDLAANVRRAFPGKSLSEITEELEDIRVNALMESTGWDEEEAREKIRARQRFESTGYEKQDADPYLGMLQTQLQQVQKRTGINMMDIISNDAYLQEQINSKEMDIKDAYAYYLENIKATNAAKDETKVQKRPLAPTVDKQSGSAPAGAARHFSEKDIERIDAMLKRGMRVRV